MRKVKNNGVVTREPALEWVARINAKREERLKEEEAKLREATRLARKSLGQRLFSTIISAMSSISR